MIAIQEIHREIEKLPPESLADLADYIAFLRFKSTNSTDLSAIDVTANEPPLHIINLRGILRDHDFSPELLRETRQEMWHKFQMEEA